MMSGWFTMAVVMHLVIPSLSQLPPYPPPFSWDTIPLFMHAMNESGALNKTAAKYMSSFPLATIEKAQGQDTNNAVCSLTQPCEEDKIIAALQQIRSYSNDVRTIFYLNSVVNYPQYNLSTHFTENNEKYLLHDDETGQLVYLTTCKSNAPNFTIFDTSYNETREFWLDTVKYALTKYPNVVDGIFADGARANTTQTPLECVNFTDKHRNDWQNGHTLMIQEAMSLVRSINKERGIIICNGANMNTLNGRLFDGFRINDSIGVPPGNNLPQLMDENGIRISEVHEDGCTFYSQKYNSSLAAFLIGAVKYSYYMCTKGWTLQTGWDIAWENKDFNQALGEPMMNATYKNNVYYREFSKGVKVWLDYQWQYPCIKWSDGSITGSNENCNKYM
eukprot:254843_1